MMHAARRSVTNIVFVGMSGDRVHVDVFEMNGDECDTLAAQLNGEGTGGVRKRQVNHHPGCME